MRNDRVRPLRHPPAFRTGRAEVPGPDLPGQRLIRRGERESFQLVEQGDRPQMRVFDQPRGHVVDERGERIISAFPHPRFALTVQVVPDRLAVPADMVGDRGDRPALPAKRVDVLVFLPCDHETGLLRTAGEWSETTSLEGDPPSWGATRVGTFDEHQWGISVSAIMVAPRYIYTFDLTAWGWIHLLIGLALSRSVSACCSVRDGL